MSSGPRRHSAVVTGGGRGIGRAVVDRLRADGGQVVTCGRGPRPDDLPRDVAWERVDVARPDDVDRLAAAAAERLGAVTLLVNNAGVQIERTVIDSTDDDWELVVGTNCRGVFNTSRAFLPELRASGGAIVNIGSVSGEVSDPSMALYNASKAFVHALTRSIAVDHGPPLRCNAVLPGWIETDMARDAFELTADPATARRDTISRHPVGRLGTPADVAALVAWLASDEAAFVSGQCYAVDGGLLAASPVRPGEF